MSRPPQTAPESLWAVEVHPSVRPVPLWTSQLLEHVRPQLSSALRQAPDRREFQFREGLLTIEARCLSGPALPGAALRLSFRPGAGSSGFGSSGVNGAAGKGANIPKRELPDPGLAERGDQLIGLDDIRDTILTLLDCRWNGRLEKWGEKTGKARADALASYLRGSCGLFVLEGPSGCGKTALAQTIADRYCREKGTAGTLLLAGTDLLRGDGTVGSLGSSIRAAVDAAREAARYGPTFLQIDEGEAVGMRRSETQSHHEDRAGTAALLQALDLVASEGLPLAVFLTTNLLGALDPALVRRGSVYHFQRPSTAQRAELIRRWLPEISDSIVSQLAQAADGMTPCDIERELARLYLSAVRQDAPLSTAAILDALKAAPRTGEV